MYSTTWRIPASLPATLYVYACLPASSHDCCLTLLLLLTMSYICLWRQAMSSFLPFPFYGEYFLDRQRPWWFENYVCLSSCILLLADLYHAEEAPTYPPSCTFQFITLYLYHTFFLPKHTLLLLPSLWLPSMYLPSEEPA